MAQFIQKPGGDKTSLEGSGFTDLQDAADKGFNPVSAPEAPKELPPVAPETSVAPETPVAPTEQPIFNKAQITENVKGTLATPGIGVKPANKAFIDAAARLKFGRNASPEELSGAFGASEFGLKGATVKDVVERFGLEDLAPNMGTTLGEVPGEMPGETALPVEEKPISIEDQIKSLRKGSAEFVTEARKEFGAGEAGERLRTAKLDTQSLKNEINKFIDISEDELSRIGDQPIPNIYIARQKGKLSEEQQRQLRDLNRELNNKLMIEAIEQGSFDKAENVAVQTAQLRFEDNESEISRLEEQQLIDSAQADLMRSQNALEEQRGTEGYILLTPEIQGVISKIDPDRLVQVGGQTYIKPLVKTPEQKQEEELKLLSQKLNIEEQLLKNELIGEDKFQSTITTPEGIYRVTFDRNGNEVNRSFVGESPAGSDKITAANSKASLFATRAEQANSILEELSGVGTSFFSAVGAGSLPEILKTEDRKRFEQAERNLITAVLRRESGAAISDSEFETAKLLYLPQPGDGKDVLEQKKKTRDIIQKGFIQEAGAAYTGNASIGGVTNTEDLFN